MAAQRTARARLQGAGFDRFLPYLLLAPAVLLVLAVVVYPLISGVQTSTKFYRFGTAISDVGFAQYRQAWNDPLFTGSALDDAQVRDRGRRDRDDARPRAGAPVRARAAVHPRRMRMVLIVPMVITPVVVGIVFRLIYASDVGLFTSLSGLVGGGSIGILDNESGRVLGPRLRSTCGSGRR